MKVDVQNVFKTITVKKQGKYNLNVHLQDLGINKKTRRKGSMI